jgi:KDO2-lipid IV(A) lauroyltransferase
MTVPLRKRMRRTLRSALLRALILAFSFVPLRPALAFARALGRVGWTVARRTRRQILAHLAVAFPEEDEAWREAVGRGSLVHLAQLAAEVATLPRWRERLAAYVSFAPGAEERLEAIAARGEGLVFATGHVGNWELLAQRIAARHPSAVIARTGNDPGLTALVGRMRLEGGVETIWREDPGSARAMLRAFKQRKLLGILIDQDTRVQGVFVPFFGRPAFTPRGAAELALRFGAPLVAGWARRRGPEPGAGHVIDFVDVPYDRDPPDREAEIVRLTAACTAHLEAAIRAAPEEWVWMHERWRTHPEDADAPGQARPVPETARNSGA